jgi:hypothetical protein
MVAEMVLVVVMFPKTVAPAASESVAEEASVIVFALVVSVPFVMVNAPFTVRPALRVNPLELFSVRLFNAATLLGRLTPLEEPPNARLEDEVVDKLAGVPAIVEPLSVRVFAPTANVPLVRVKVPPIVSSESIEAPALLSSVKL